MVPDLGVARWSRERIGPNPGAKDRQGHDLRSRSNFLTGRRILSPPSLSFSLFSCRKGAAVVLEKSGQGWDTSQDVRDY